MEAQAILSIGLPMEMSNPDRRDSLRLGCMLLAYRARLRLSFDNTTDWRNEMIKVSVMYPNTPGARFNHEYYRDTHMPLLKKRLGDACLYYTVDKGLAGGAPGTPATYVGMCHFFCETVDSFQAAFGPHAEEIMGDIPNYTDLAPVIQISEVVVERS